MVITGQWYLVKELVDDATIQRLLNNSNVHAWFCQNLDMYAANFTQHPKVHPFPYGLYDAPMNHKFDKRQVFLDAVESAAAIRNDSHRGGLHLGYFDLVTNPEQREGIPRGPQQGVTEYYDSLALNRYLFSPNGDRPDCYRHYEAIGLGAIPITQMDPWTHRHLTGSVIFNNTDWNVTSWNSSVEGEDPSGPIRDMIYQDYWKGYVERQTQPNFELG